MYKLNTPCLGDDGHEQDYEKTLSDNVKKYLLIPTTLFITLQEKLK